jgi:hypothetical protein
MPVENVEKSGEGELVDSGHPDAEDSGRRVHAIRENVAAETESGFTGSVRTLQLKPNPEIPVPHPPLRPIFTGD